jgi:hypothetical protein
MFFKHQLSDKICGIVDQITNVFAAMLEMLKLLPRLQTTGSKTRHVKNFMSAQLNYNGRIYVASTDYSNTVGPVVKACRKRWLFTDKKCIFKLSLTNF